MDRLRRLLRIRRGEGRVAGLLLAMMVVLFAGMTLGSAGVESLFFSRSGPRNLPTLYIALGPLTFGAMTVMGWLLARPDPRGVLVWTFPAIAAVAVLAWALVETGEAWVYPVLWLAMMILWTVGVFAAWGLAGSVHDTRQAKRLFPLYGAGLILGGGVGGVATGPLAAWISAERLLLVWAASLLVVAWLASLLARRAPERVGGRGGRARPFRELAGGMRAVRAAPLLRWMAVALALFSLLYFALAFVFAEAVTARFPEADRLAGFLGLFAAGVNLSALVVSLLVANRLFGRFGLVPMILVLPVVYLAGFSLLLAATSFSVIVAFRAVQMVWVNGVWGTGWQALFAVVPAERRGQVRVFMDAVPLQAGIVVSGALLLLADRLSWSAEQVAVIGLVAAALAVGAMWSARRGYVAALVSALRAGNPEVFAAEEEPFAGFARDRAAVRAVVAGAGSEDPLLRRVSLEMLVEMGGAEARTALVEALRDPDEGVRRAALEGVARLPSPEAATGALAMLDVAHLRSLAAEALAACVRAGAGAADRLRALLHDPDPEVAAAAASGIGEVDALRRMAASPEPGQRAAAVRALARVATDAPRVRIVVSALGDPDPTVREAAMGAIALVGDAAVFPLVDALADPASEGAALQALVSLGPPDVPELRRYAAERVALAAEDGRSWRALEAATDGGTELLAETLRHRSFERGMWALMAASSGDRARSVVLENLLSRDPGQRANAFEVLEAAGDRDVTRPLLAVWDASAPRVRPEAAIRAAFDDADPWVRACAVLAAAGRDLSISAAAASDPDPLVRETARLAGMETLATVPLLERVVFLRRVPLFADLAPADVKHVAEVAAEQMFTDGVRICEQGDPGDELYIVVSGRIRVVRGEDEVARRGPGEYVGEMAVITGGVRMASLVADGEVRALVVDRRRFERILRDRPDASLAVMRTLCQRLEESHATA